MKKLTRANLDMLAECMPVLSENQQRGYIGGTRYYCLSGQFLGSLGPGNDIRVVDRVIYESNQCYYPNSETELYDSSTPLNRTSDSIKKAVLTTLAGDVGIDNIGFRVFNEESGSYQQSTGLINIGLNSSYIQNGGYYEIQMLMIHEQDHSNRNCSSRNEYEYYGYLAIQQHPNFRYTSIDFQRQVNDLVQKYKSLTGQ